MAKKLSKTAAAASKALAKSTGADNFRHDAGANPFVPSGKGEYVRVFSQRRVDGFLLFDEFDDDPRLTPEMRKRSLQEGDMIVRPQMQPDGSQRCLATFLVDVRGSASPSAPSPSARG